ncbi:hypothetical protein [Nocardia sp. NPDC051750]|uniref:hypothetical protein n=1 Tax=Nocardia sp. NPDC051750 TaxID=3364325 RepID=UPI00378BA7EB
MPDNSSDQIPPAVRSMIDLIGRQSAHYALRLDELGTVQADGKPLTERSLLANFHQRVEQVVVEYEKSNVPPRGDALVFEQVHRPSPEDPDILHGPAATIRKLLALEVEFRGPRRLSGTQNMYLAELYEVIGGVLKESGLPAHAALAYKRATYCFDVAEDVTAQDRCRLARARAKRQATIPRWRRIPGFVSDMLCGYGFKPFQLLAWIAVQLVLFTGLYWILQGDELTGHSLADAARVCFTNYLNPMGVDNLNARTQVLLLVESWTGIIFLSVLFALLVRRWFRF